MISGNMDRLYDNMWKDLRRTDFPTWAAFVAEFRKLYGKLKESGQEVTPKSACIYLFEKVRTFLPIWTEINESQYYSQPNVEKLLLELETRGRQLEYDGIILANLRTNGDRNPRDFVNESRARGAGESRNRTEKSAQREDSPQGQSQLQRQESREKDHHSDKKNKRNGTSQRERHYCETCDKTHPGDCWPVCRDCEIWHSPNGSVTEIKSLRIDMRLQGIMWGRITHAKEINPELAQQTNLAGRPKAFSSTI